MGPEFIILMLKPLTAAKKAIRGHSIRVRNSRLGSEPDFPQTPIIGTETHLTYEKSSSQFEVDV